jgi:hypothetical protein
VKFAAGKRLERVDFYNQKTGSEPPPNKSAKWFEHQVLTIRQYLKEKSMPFIEFRQCFLFTKTVKSFSPKPAAKLFKRNSPNCFPMKNDNRESLKIPFDVLLTFYAKMEKLK